MTPKLDIPITLELAKSAYPQYNWVLGYQVSEDFSTVTRVPMFGEGPWKGLLQWTHENINHRHIDDITTYRWVLSIISVDRLCYSTKDELRSELAAQINEYESKSRLFADLQQVEQS